MRKNLLFLIAFLTLGATSNAQHIIDGYPMDSTSYTFEVGDSLTRRVFDRYAPCVITLDTTDTHLWQIGKTHKPFFTDSTDTTYAIMTDTANVYPINANDWFVLKMIHPPFNMIIDFWHKYQTTAGHDGGIVEFSIDSGTTWQNVLGNCHVDSTDFGSSGINTDNFYGKSDTLLTGEQAFSGISNGWQYSRIQFFTGLPIRKTGGGTSCSWISANIYLRFRFESDSVADSLDGWIIDNIKIEQDHYEGAVRSVARTLDSRIYPNPSTDGIFNFPPLDNEQNCNIEITNALGQSVISIPYCHKINLQNYPNGVYFYRITNGSEYYSGHLVVQ